MIRERKLQGGHFSVSDERRGPSYLVVTEDIASDDSPTIYIAGNDGRAWQLANIINDAINEKLERSGG